MWQLARRRPFCVFLKLPRRLASPASSRPGFLDFPLRTYQRRLKEGRLQAREVPAAEFLPALYEEAMRGFGDSGRAREWITYYVPALGARPVDLLGDLEGYRRVQAALGSALYGFP